MPVGLLIGILLVVLVFWMVADQSGGREVSYSRFLELVEAGRVKVVAIRGATVEGEVRGKLPVGTEAVTAEYDPSESEKFFTFAAEKENVGERLDTYNRGLTDPTERAAKQVAYRNKPANNLPVTLLLWLPMLLIMGVVLFFLMRRMGGMGEQVMAFGKSKARISMERNTNTTFDDVAGCDEAKAELTEIIQYLKHSERFKRLGAKIPKGVLLMGPPGTGKTLMARAVAGEAGVPFISVSGPEFMEMFVGVGAARVRDLFAKAKQKAPCIIFMDEIDAVGRHRGAGMGGGQEEREQTLNQMLVEMDGFEGNLGIIVLAATNRPDVLDPALMRPGRFDRQVVLDLPDHKGRKEILAVHAKDKVMADTIDLDLISKLTPGFTGADLANVMNEAALLAARKNRDQVEMDDCEEAIDRVMTGPERRSRVIRPNEKRVIAYHECGHAIVAAYLPAADPVHKVSIIPRGHAALGYTMQLPETDRYLTRKQELLDKICVSLGGRTAEQLIFGHMSTGAANDLEHVTSIARSMVCRFGMSEALGPIAFERSSRSFLPGMESTLTGNYSEATLAAIDAEVTSMVLECQERTRGVLDTNRGLLEKMAEKLLEVEILDAAEFKGAIAQFCSELGLEPPPERSETGATEASA